MFGDVGHGILLTLFAVGLFWACRNGIKASGDASIPLTLSLAFSLITHIG